MELFALEHKRLWRTTRVWLCVLLCFVYSVVWGSVVWNQWPGFGSTNDSTDMYDNNFDGYSNIRGFQEEFSQFGDEWTDETLQKMVAKYQSYDPMNRPGLRSMGDWILASGYLNKLYPELEDPEGQEYQPLIHYVDTTKLTDFYQRRADLLEFTLETTRQNEGMSEADKQMLLDMNSKIKEPWPYEWTQGWSDLSFGWSKMAPYLAIALAFVFSGEWYSNTAPLLHTTKYGWKKLARVKVLGGMAFALEFYLLIAGGKVLVQLIYFGTSGWDLPVQYISLLAVAPWNMLQAELYQLAFGLIGMFGYAGLVMLMSALAKNNVLALVYSLAFVYVPDVLGRYLPKWLMAVSQYLPLVGNSYDYLSYNIFHIFGMSVWSPWMLITVPFLIGVVCIPFAIKGWARRQKV